MEVIYMKVGNHVKRIDRGTLEAMLKNRPNFDVYIKFGKFRPELPMLQVKTDELDIEILKEMSRTDRNRL